MMEIYSNSDVPLIYKYDVVEEINNTAISKDLEVVSILKHLGGTEMGGLKSLDTITIRTMNIHLLMEEFLIYFY